MSSHPCWPTETSHKSPRSSCRLPPSLCTLLQHLHIATQNAEFGYALLATISLVERVRHTLFFSILSRKCQSSFPYGGTTEIHSCGPQSVFTPWPYAVHLLWPACRCLLHLSASGNHCAYTLTNQLSSVPALRCLPSRHWTHVGGGSGRREGRRP